MYVCREINKVRIFICGVLNFRQVEKIWNFSFFFYYSVCSKMLENCVLVLSDNFRFFIIGVHWISSQKVKRREYLAQKNLYVHAGCYLSTFLQLFDMTFYLLKLIKRILIESIWRTICILRESHPRCTCIQHTRPFVITIPTSGKPRCPFPEIHCNKTFEDVSFNKVIPQQWS